MTRKVTRDEILDSLCAPVAKALKANNVTLASTIKVFADGMQATEIKTAFEKERGKWYYSKPLIDHPTRINSADSLVGIMGIKKPKEVNVNHSGKIEFATMTDKELDEKILELTGQAKS